MATKDKETAPEEAAIDQIAEQEELLEKLPDDPSDPDEPSTPPPRRRAYRRRWLLIVLAVLVVAGAAFATWWLWWRPGADEPSPTTPSDSSQQQVAEQPTSPELQRFLHPTTGETWHETPRQLAKQGFYSNPDGGSGTHTDPTTGQTYSVDYSDVTYYEVGTRGDKTIILSYIAEMFGRFDLFERAPDGTVAVIAQPTHDTPENFTPPTATDFAEGVVIDATTRYDSLSLPATITLDDGTTLQRPSYATFGALIGAAGQSDIAPGVSRRQVQALGASRIYRVESSFADTQLTNVGYTIETPAHTTYSLVYEPLPLRATQLAWLGAPATEDETQEYIKPIARGCGVGDRITRSDTLRDDDLQVFKTSPEGVVVSTIKDPNHPLWVKAYEEFQQFIQYDTANPYANLTKEQFIAENAVLVYQDAHKDYLVYVRSDLAPAGGCAKPVVYLYPTRETLVHVKVGADVKISEPHYDPQAGWTALARPDGQLRVNGQTYGSLFWEGPGWGQYPAITSGTIVERGMALAAIRGQLASKGFNTQEIADFVDYWHDKLPAKPYIRLSWLTTEQMNNLAPLQISPRPDTLIRTFLDFSGLDAPIDLAPQTFSAPERRGFTVTEWGGLSPYRLY